MQKIECFQNHLHMLCMLFSEQNYSKNEVFSKSLSFEQDLLTPFQSTHRDAEDFTFDLLLAALPGNFRPSPADSNAAVSAILRW